MKRRKFITLLANAAAAWPLAARAQQEKVARIGFLGATFASSWASRIEALQSGLRDLGYVILVEQATKFETVLNIRAAKSLGVTIPMSILLGPTE